LSLPNLETGGKRHWKLSTIADCTQLDQPAPVTKARGDLRSDLKCKPSFPNPGGSGQTDESVFGQEPPHLRDLAVAAHEAGQLNGEVARRIRSWGLLLVQPHRYLHSRVEAELVPDLLDVVLRSALGDE
jgi:hypothetical protein